MATMGDRATKLRRLNVFRRSLPHASGSALAAVLDEITRHGVPDLHGRHHLRQATTAVLAQETPYGNLLVPIKLVALDGTIKTMDVVNPLAMLLLAAELPGMDDLLQARFSKSLPSPETPWDIILYSDEIVPGNQMSYDNRRKLWAAYWSFKQFGTAALAREDAWFVLMCQRSSEVNKISNCMKKHGPLQFLKS